MARKQNRGGGILGALAVAAIGTLVANKADNRSDSKINKTKKNTTKRTMEKVDDLTALMSYMNKLLISNKIKANHYMQIGQQACKEYKQLNGKLHLEDGVEKYVVEKLNFIEGVEKLQEKLKR